VFRGSDRTRSVCCGADPGTGDHPAAGNSTSDDITDDTAPERELLSCA